MDKLQQIRHLALDLDGTLYLGTRLLSGTRRLLDLLPQLGIGRTFLTNNSSRSTAQYMEHLAALGIDAKRTDFYSSVQATLDYLRTERPELQCLYVLGTPALREEFAAAGYRLADDHKLEPEAVVVGFDTTLSYDRLCQTAYWISRGKLFVATHPDRVCPTDKPTLLPDCGAICSLLTSATGREPDVVLGKPHPQMLKGVLARHGLTPAQLAIVGDRLYTDMQLAQASGALGILVLSGETTRRHLAASPLKPDLVVRDVNELADLLQAGRDGRSAG